MAPPMKTGGNRSVTMSGILTAVASMSTDSGASGLSAGNVEAPVLLLPTTENQEGKAASNTEEEEATVAVVASRVDDMEAEGASALRVWSIPCESNDAPVEIEAKKMALAALEQEEQEEQEVQEEPMPPSSYLMDLFRMSGAQFTDVSLKSPDTQKTVIELLENARLQDAVEQMEARYNEEETPSAKWSMSVIDDILADARSQLLPKDSVLTKSLDGTDSAIETSASTSVLTDDIAAVSSEPTPAAESASTAEPVAAGEGVEGPAVFEAKEEKLDEAVLNDLRDYDASFAAKLAESLRQKVEARVENLLTSFTSEAEEETVEALRQEARRIIQSGVVAELQSKLDSAPASSSAILARLADEDLALLFQTCPQLEAKYGSEVQNEKAIRALFMGFQAKPASDDAGPTF